MKTLFTFLSVMILSFSLQAQYVYTDFEDNQNVSFTGWPNSPVTIENPDASGINTSDSVAEFVRSGEAWAHALCELDGTINFDEGTTFTIKVWAPIVNEMLFKLESADGSNFIENFQTIETTEEWVEMSFDFPDAENGVYSKIVLFFDAGNNTDNTYYFDDLEGPGFGEQQETYIYSDFDENQNESFSGWPNPPVTIENPDPSGINTSDSVAEFVRSSEAWAHAICELDGTINFDETTTFTVKVWSPLAKEMLLKLESADGSSVIENFKNIETTEEWVEKSFDFPDAENGVYSKIVLFFDPGNNTDTTYYFDEVAGPGYESGGGGEEKPLEANNIQKNFEDGDWSTDEEWMFQDPDMVALPVTTDPQDDANNVGDYNRSGDFEYTNAQVELDHRMDLSERHVFEMKVYFPSSNDYSGDLTPTAAVKLQNSLLGANAWQTQFEVKHTVETYDEWVTMQFDFNEVSDSVNYDQIVVQFGGEAHTTPGQFYFDDFMLRGGLGINEHQLKRLSIHPNPVNEFVSIDSDANFNRVEIMDISGKLVKTSNKTNASRIDVSSLEKGMYIINVYQDTKLVGFSKLIKR
ncbi:MAG: T9SS type A sorting domain-containing protein [Bacteroidales bacterium]|nr:T9SS type A sorting domain-containing protein [Bacteroidales bacterium]MCF8336385.1 T9SS type A sorting domain-containing protein [Bacteroidales bacterium]